MTRYATSTQPAITAPTLTSTSPYCSGKTAGRLGAMLRRRQRFHMASRLLPAPAIVEGVQDVFGTVLFVVVALGVVVAGITMATSSGAYKQIGKGGLFGDDDGPRPREGSGSVAVRDEEIRQMLQARSDRRVRKGGEPLDIEAELTALTRTQVDPQLLAEIRKLVAARNRRRIRQGKEPLDVEAEVARQLADLT